MREVRSDGTINLVDIKTIDKRFAQTVKTLGARMKQLTSQGVGTNTRQAETLSVDDKRRLWEGGVFGLSTGP